MSQIICCANSIKEGKRCIAGLEPQSGEWIRPVSNRSSGAVTRDSRIVNGREPQILDVLEVPFENFGPDKGFQPENKLLKSGPWQLIRIIKPEELLDYCESSDIILHNHLDYIPFTHLKLIPKRGWKSLQLINSENMICYQYSGGGKPKWRARFEYRRGTRIMDLRITDPVIMERLNHGEVIKGNCLLTISLGLPWRPNNKTELRCYKFVAGLVKL